MSRALPRLANVDSRWLALPLSARGLVEELAKVVDDDGGLETSLVDGADARAVADELARLLCAFSNERARIRRDVAALLERGFLVVEGSRVRLVGQDLESAPASDTVLAERSSPSPRGSAKRMQVLRARQRAAKEASQRDALHPSHVTPSTVTRDAGSDAGDASHVTRALSLDLKNLSSNQEREGARDARDAARDARRWLPRDAPFCERAREIAAAIGVREPELVWRAFLARYAEKRLERDWDREWDIYAVREKRWERSEAPIQRADRPTVKQAVDLDAPWLRAASESS